MNNVDLSKTPNLFLLPLNERYNKIFKYFISSSYWKKLRKKIFKTDLYQLSFINKKDVDLIIKHGMITSNSSIVDIGCGVSNIIKYIHKKTKAKIYGFDISDFAIKYQKNGITDNIILNNKNLNEIDFNKNTYDVIYSIDSHYFIKDKIKLFNKIYDGLKSKGRLILYTQIFDQKNINLSVDEILINFINDMKEIGYKLIFKKEKTKNLNKISKKQTNYWNKYKNGLIKEISNEIWSAFNWEHKWTRYMIENKKLKRFLLVFEKYKPQSFI